jgi:type II secretory ATPase GspE/PulE/Tfp pilus assembly ATPase PilB-like protein
MNAPRIPNTALAAELTELLSVVDPSAVADVLLKRAFDHRATDVHLDPTPAGLRVRFRVDGQLQDILPIPAAAGSHVVARIKVTAGMDTTERRHPQDGHITAQEFDGITRDIRVSSLPTVHGERLTLRLMPDSDEITRLENLGFFDDQLEDMRRLLESPYGLILIAGPGGSGKSTTLFGLLRALNTPGRSLVTIEDPVERLLPGANQIRVEGRSGLSFASALRGVLRQDPDVLGLGEIRDAETTAIACRAAMSGALVLSTFHAGSTASALSILSQYGVPATILGDSLRGIISQRLVRCVSPDSREEYIPDDDVADRYGLERGKPVVRGVPVDSNFQTGYTGRIAIFETLRVTPAVRDAIDRSASTDEIQRVAVQEGMTTLEESVRRHVQAQTTSIEQLERVLSEVRL